MLQSILRVFTFLWLFYLPANGQSTNPGKEIDNYFAAVLKGQDYNLSSGAIKTADSKKILKLASENMDNENPQVRYKIIDLVKRKALTEPDAALRRKFVTFLLQSVKDPDSGNSGVASKCLTHFIVGDFDKQAGDSLYSLLIRKPYHYDLVLKLAGFVNTKKCRELLQVKLVSDTLLNAKDKWVIQLALARMGDSASGNYCFNKLKSQALSDKLVTYLYPDFVYTRQTDILQFILNQILTDNKVCNSSSPETDEKTICAFKIMEIVAPAISNFPVQVTKYGDLETDDYCEALVKVRNWIQSKPEIKIVTEYF